MSFPHGQSGSFSGHPALMFCNFCFGFVATRAMGALAVSLAIVSGSVSQLGPAHKELRAEMTS